MSTCDIIQVMVTVIDVTNNKKLFKIFVDFPNKLYKDNPYYVPFIYPDEINMLDPVKNPAIVGCEVRCFLAMKDGAPAGRIAGILNRRYNDKTGEKRMRFSRFDFIDDAEVVHALLNAVEEYAREKGMNIVHGPFGFNDTDREGYLTEGFNEIATMTTNYNFSYYDPRIKEQGYQKECGWLESNLSLPAAGDPYLEKVLRVSEMIQKRYNVSLAKPQPMKQLLKERTDEFFDIYMDAYKDLPGFIEYSEAQKKQIAKAFTDMLKPEYLPLVLDKDGKLVAFGVFLPDFTAILQKSRGRMGLFTLLRLLKTINKPKDKMELLLVGVRNEWRNKGVNALLIKGAIDVFRKFGITNLETNLNAEDNPQILAMWDGIPRRQHKKRICVYKKL